MAEKFFGLLNWIGIFSCLILACPSFATGSSGLWQIHLESYTPVVSGGPAEEVFLFPNELLLDSSLHIWKSAKARGAYISVGSERSFVGATLSKSDFLITIDMNPLVAKFNQMNAVLLAVSNSPQDYLYLRLKAPLAELLQRQKTFRRATALTSEDWIWWQNLHQSESWQSLFLGDEPSDSIKRFRSLAYWTDSDKWVQLKNMALSGRMGFFTADFKNFESLRKIILELKKLGIRPSVIDTSNVLEYIGADSMVEALKILGDLTSPEAAETDPVQWIYSQLLVESGFYGVSQGSGERDSAPQDSWVFNSRPLTFNHPALQEAISSAMRSFPGRNRNFRCERLFMDL